MIRTARRTLAALLLLGSAQVSAAETIKWLHVEVNPVQIGIWNEAARTFEASHPGVKVEPQYLENEAYKAKLTTHAAVARQAGDLLQLGRRRAAGAGRSRRASRTSPHVAAGYTSTITPTAMAAFTINGQIYGVPQAHHRCRLLLQQGRCSRRPASTAAQIKTWDDLLGAVKALKAAGITPLTAGGADKWPLSFYLVVSVAAPGRQGRFRGGAEGREWRLRRAGLRQGRASTSSNSSTCSRSSPACSACKTPAGDRPVRRRQGGDDARHQHRLCASSSAIAADKKGLATNSSAGSTFPPVPGGKGVPTDTLGGIIGWARQQGRAVGNGGLPEIVRFARGADASWPPPASSSRSSRAPTTAIDQPVHAARRRRAGALDLSPELLRPGARPLRRPHRQRRGGRDRRRQHDAARRRPRRSRRRGSRGTDRGVTAATPARGRRRRSRDDRRRRPAAVRDGCGRRAAVPAAGAAAVHAVRRAAGGRGRLVQRVQLERLRPPDAMGGRGQLRCRVADPCRSCWRCATMR